MSLDLIRARAQQAVAYEEAGAVAMDVTPNADWEELNYAREVVLLCDIATAAATLVRLKDGSRDWSYWNEKESAWNDLRAALARLETEAL